MRASQPPIRRGAIVLSVLLFLLATAAVAQQGARRPLTHRDYAGWKSITNTLLSRDGKWLAYAVFPQEGDGELIVRSLADGKEYRESLGALPPAPDPDGAEPDGPPPRRGVQLSFTAGGRYVVSSTYPAKADVDNARKAKNQPEQMPKGGLVIIDLASGAGTRVPDVKSFQAPEKGGGAVAWLKEPIPQPADDEKKGSGENKTDAAARSGSRARAGKKTEYGSELVLRDLTRPGAPDRVFQDVIEYDLSRNGGMLVYAVSSRKPEENGVFALGTFGGSAPAALLKGKGKYTKVTFDRENTQLAFLSDRDGKRTVYYWDLKTPAAAELISPATPGFRPEFVISDKGNLNFSRDGSRLFVPCAPPAPPEKSETAPAEDKVLADLWRWNDDYIQPMQKVQAARERNRTYTAVFHLDAKAFVQLADKAMPGVTPSDDGRFAIGNTDKPYRPMVDFDGRYADYFVVDTRTGSRYAFAEKMRGGGSGGGMMWSPDSRRALFFRDQNWFTVSVPSGATANLTAGLRVKFYQEDDDHPETPGPYGAAGWTSDGKTVLVYDRYDIWQISADGSNTVNLTNGAGRKARTEFRVARLADGDNDEKPRGIERDKALILRAENTETRETGFWRDRLDSAAPPEMLIMGPRNYRAVAKAKDADTVVVTASTFAEFPDLQLTDSNFREFRKVSDVNPQRAGLLWGKGELIRFRNADGAPLQAALYKPDNFDPNKKYPMMVYIYEKLSQNLHNFVEPRPATSINLAYYVSNGYIVLTPDIVYTVGAPGQSALKCVLPAIQAVVDKGYVNEQAIGIQGHSWGGYQVAYMLTQTTRFRAAEAGAPVGNMVSAYNGIRWGSGLPRQFQYEKTQSRIGGSLWQYPMRFVENSPVFMADRVKTPLLILHDDNDDAVPWYQGIELFLSLRRNGSEAYLFNYNGEWHGLRKRHNQKDYTVRMQQFFDHFLKGAPKPEWMERGIPYIEREEEKEKFAAAADLK